MAKKKKNKKIKLKIKNILIILGILILIILSFFFALNMPIKNIYISGNKIIKESEILEQSKIENYPSFLKTSKKEIIQNLQKNPYIKKVKVTKKLGNVIEITIKEYIQVAKTKENKIILENGTQVENIYELTDIPLLVNDLQETSLIKNFSHKFSKLNENIKRQISEIEYSKTDVDEERFLLYMSDGNLVYITLTKIDKLNKYNQIKDKLEGKIGIIYLDSGNYVQLK